MTRIQRLFRIGWVFSKYRLDEFLPLTDLPWPVRFVLLFAPWHFFPVSDKPRGERLRLALEELGPIFVKFGQILSTRRDLLPDDMALALQQLQDRVPPFPGEKARGIVESSLGQPVAKLFKTFDSNPMASASVAQVHAATLHGGQAVVVKVIRPDIERVIRQDIALMLVMARLLERYWSEGRRLRPVEVVRDYEQTIYDELDMQREAANASQLRRNFEGSTLIYIPDVFWDYTSQQVLVMERIQGIPVADTEALNAAGVNMKVLAEKGVEIFFTQVFRDSFFHADMHPGNIFVDASNPQDPRYIAIDFGIVGTLAPEDQSYLARNLLAFFRRNYRQVAELHIQSGWVPAHTRVNEFEAAIRTVCEPIFERPLKEISFGHFLLRLFQTARRFEMEVQPQLVLLQKTLLNVEGLGRQLYPDLDLWSTAQPFLESWMRHRIGPPGMLKSLREHLPAWLEQSPEMPQLVHDALLRIRDLDRTQNTDHATIRAMQRAELEHRRGMRRIAAGIACLFGAWMVTQPTSWASLEAVPLPGWALIAVAGWLLVGRRSRISR
ncbi:ubiquinone biosynthesis regulatory protein kinase UbiB [Marinobacter nanhaiticus D15-8W]|uniref:Probable protein kinase UbiB n=1 Tax=Marinobacter nanhaiticus D15-8W TaxID=626887 RepID=N6WW95_9GAMM|nr:ubiquinone biosynthesis regulatory protein kinase UbiB [Marinobacter nanhaiticus]ENO15856.1 ubiquinone biosynthesis regulatory protein kinase UbiB [Marinobacter nanhaiticus D15-8W]BES73287.1 ubiquinone biosynthesis regulatory protein kinase UbiB [Marinobacter nanhaiticus D15-8W]